MSDNDNSFRLPLSIAQVTDVGRVLRELNLINEHLNQIALKDPSRKVVVKCSTHLAELVKVNDLDITNNDHRSRIVAELNNLKTFAPVINVSFGSEASAAFTQKIAQWFRQEIDPNCLLIVGLEPSIGAGSIVRTNNKIFNLSLRSRVKNSRDVLLAEIKKLEVKQEA